MTRLDRLSGVLVMAGIAALSASCASAQKPLTDGKASEGTRPYIFGCGIMWGYWHDLPWEKSWQWTEMCMDYIVEMGGTNCPADIVWADIEKERGVYDWSRVDRQVEAALKRGLTMFAYTGLTPDWALPDEVPRGKGLGYRYPPKEEFAEDFERWCEAVATRYRGKITHFQLWNEPNGCSWINDGCSNGHMAHTYVPWLKRWYTAMKRGNPDSILAVGGLDYNSGVRDGYRYIEDIYANGGGDYFDHVAIHPYGEPLHWKAIEDTYACLVRHGHGHKKLWLNEYGWNTRNEQQKSENLITVLTELKKRKYHYVYQANQLILTDLNKNGHDYGFCDGDPDALTITPRLSYETFKAFDKTFEPLADQPPDDEDLLAAYAPAESPGGPNLLTNPNFEMDFEDAPAEFQDNEPKRLKAPGWHLWGGNWWTRSGGDGHLNHTPFGAQSVATNWGVLRNAVFQRVKVTKGRAYEFSAWTRGDAPDDAEYVWTRVAVDPKGGVDPGAASIEGSEWASDQGKWKRQTIRVKADSDIITVFTEAKSTQPKDWHWFHVDTAELVEVK